MNVQCGKNMVMRERKGTIDGYEWRCRTKGGENPHDVCKSIRKAGMKKMDGDCKAKLAAGTVGFEAGVGLFTNPISEVVKCI
ncbi:hypothetical protein TNCV_3160131 [Trichonephila clavipes]|nr:hypothetical protein TNCV_3160131 [Trichonephila clavipes]